MVECEQFAENLGLNLLDKIVDGVAINKMSFLGVVSVEIEIEGKSVCFDEMVSKRPNCKNSRLPLEFGINIVSVEVLAESVHPEVPVIDSIDVDHGHNHEDKHLFQEIAPCIFGVDQKINNPLHRIAGSSLSGMHSSSDQNNRFFEPFRPAPLRKQPLIKKFLLLRLAGRLVMGGNSQQMHQSLLRRLSQNFFVIVKLIMRVKFIESVEVVDAGGVGVGVCEGKLDLVLLIFEGEFYLHLELACLSEDQGSLCCHSLEG